ncbi:hypothetical protein C8R45DRAFT_1073590 [Mycena sanguinolenta]|nr:hypothetical protein C8R45DRAFT_1073590 [Mycena sanguinolenta]
MSPIFDHTVNADQSTFLGFGLEGVAYGIHVLLFGSAVTLLARSNSPKGPSIRPIFAASCLLFCMGTVHYAINFNNVYTSTIYRCYLVWNKNIWVVVLPILVAFGAASVKLQVRLWRLWRLGQDVKDAKDTFYSKTHEIEREHIYLRKENSPPTRMQHRFRAAPSSSTRPGGWFSKRNCDPGEEPGGQVRFEDGEGEGEDGGAFGVWLAKKWVPAMSVGHALYKRAEVEREGTQTTYLLLCSSLDGVYGFHHHCT